MKKRFLFHDIIKQLNHKNTLLITGMRQVGKTTLMRQVFDVVDKPRLWFDFDNPLDQMMFEEKDYNHIYHNLLAQTGSKKDRLFVFIDEIQNFPEITKIIKFLIDHYKIKFIITGSSNFYLKNLFPESLSGRKFLYTLYPMEFKEFLYFQDDEISENLPVSRFPTSKQPSVYLHEKRLFQYDQFMNYGGFPEVVTTEDIATKTLILKNIFTSFFEKDINLLSDIKDIRELRDLIILLVPRTGNILDVTKLSSELGINRVKMYSYLDLLQGLFFIHLVPKYSHSIDRSVAGGKKVYFSDTGLLNMISKINEGQLFENTVANQLIHHGALSYYNKRNTAEIDFILDNKVAIEVKLRGSQHDIARLKKIAGGLNIKDCYVVSKHFRDEAGFVSPTEL